MSQSVPCPKMSKSKSSKEATVPTDPESFTDSNAGGKRNLDKDLDPSSVKKPKFGSFRIVPSQISPAKAVKEENTIREMVAHAGGREHIYAFFISGSIKLKPDIDNLFGKG